MMPVILDDWFGGCTPPARRSILSAPPQGDNIAGDLTRYVAREIFGLLRKDNSAASKAA